MAYITHADIEMRLGAETCIQLADDDGDGVADPAVVDEARLAAEGEVNSYLAVRYRVPIDTAASPELAGLLRSVTLDLVECRLRARRPPVPEEARRCQDMALDWLRRVAEGTVELPATAELPATPTRGPLGQVAGETRVLTREELTGH